MKAINVNIIINSIRSRKDKSIGFSAETPELTALEKVAFMEMQGLNVKALFEPLDELTEDVLEVDKDLETKSQAQRIRSVLFILWKQRGEQGEFRDFYRDQTEKIINKIKGLLD